jgi:hypothetical protein
MDTGLDNKGKLSLLMHSLLKYYENVKILLIYSRRLRMLQIGIARQYPPSEEKYFFIISHTEL